MGFTPAELELIDQTHEVEIETSTPEGVTHRTIVWVVVDDGAVFIRSFVGPRARWYRGALADPSVTLHVEGHRLPATATLAGDPDSIARASAGFERKYADDPATPRINRAEVLDLTLRLDPADPRTTGVRTTAPR